MATTADLWNELIGRQLHDGITFRSEVPAGKTLVDGSGRAGVVTIDAHTQEAAQNALNTAYQSIVLTFGPLAPVEILHNVEYVEDQHAYVVSAYRIQ